MAQQRKKKDRFADLAEDFKTNIQSMDDVDIRKAVSKAALEYEELLQAKEGDEDLKEKQEAASEAGAIYRNGQKQFRLKMAYCKQTLEDRGKDPTDIKVSVNGGKYKPLAQS